MTPLYFRNIDASWTLFLDRDGVINIEKENDYIYSWDEFRFYDDALPAIQAFSRLFGKVIILTNQRGVGKGFMSEAQLREIHENMLQAISLTGGRIDAIYTCTAVNDDDPRRKPNCGMALEAKQDFPDIDFERSVMIGNRLSDMQLGKSLGMKTIYLQTTHPEYGTEHPLVDVAFGSLAEVVNAIRLERI